MPCSAPVRGKTDAKYPWDPDINNDPCGHDDYAGGLCKLHWQMANGLVGAGADPYTVLLLHGESLVDSSLSPHPITATNSVTSSTAQSKFGGSSLRFDGFLSIPDSPDWAFGTGEFTVECWVRFDAVANPQCFIGHRPDGSTLAWSLAFVPPNLRFMYSADGVNPSAFFTAPWTPAAATWYHVAVVRAGANLRSYVNGTQIGTDFGPVGAPLPDVAGVLQIGAELGVAGSTIFPGYMDEIRISKVARWTANFTPPTAPY